jgi:hypothetical protein
MSRFICMTTCVVLLTLQRPSFGEDCSMLYRLPSGVANFDRSVGYFAAPDDKIVALDLKTGRTIWTSTATGVPLGPAGRALAVQLSGVQTPTIAVVEVDGGRQLFRSESVGSPAKSLFDNRYNSLVRRICETTGQTLLIWESDYRYAGGAPPPDFEIERQKQESRGAISIDLAAKEVKIIGGRDLDARFSSDPAVQTIRSDAYWTGAAWSTEPIKFGGGQWSLEITRDENANSVILQKLDSRGAKIEQSTTVAEGGHLRAQLCLNSGHLLVYAVPSGTTSKESDSMKVSVISLEQGRQVAETECSRLLELATVAQTVVYYSIAQPVVNGTRKRELACQDLKTGRVVWKSALRSYGTGQPPRLRP